MNRGSTRINADQAIDPSRFALRRGVGFQAGVASVALVLPYRCPIGASEEDRGIGEHGLPRESKFCTIAEKGPVVPAPDDSSV